LVMPHRVEPQTSPKTKQRARDLRWAAPVAENILWELLRARRLGGLKFRRQQPIGPYFADFFCEAAKLVVELDGASHESRVQHDRRRDGYMRGRGLAVLRIPNDDLARNERAVVARILALARCRVKCPHPDPLPRGEGE
jgi:very-short-patch-repair endonuclease